MYLASVQSRPSGGPAAWGLALACCLGLLAGTGGGSWAAGERSAADPAMPLAFDILPQPLPKALAAFSAASGIEVLVDARNAEGRQSLGVRGLMTPRQALLTLLSGTSLAVEELAPETVTLKRSRQPAGPRAPAVADPPYFAVVQRAVLRALCRVAETAPGGYRLALRLQIDPTGVVSRWKLLDSTGNADRDRAFAVALSGLDIGEPPPPDLPQPVALVILPQASRDPVDCPAAAPAARRASN
jgi:hypothetical protein